MRHVFYRQYLLPTGKLADAVKGDYAKDGIELAGGEIGVHFGADGALQTVFGTQFRGVAIANDLVVDRAWDAYQATQGALATYPDFSPLDWSTLPSDTVSAQLAETKLLLMSSGDGHRFTLVWEVPVVDRDWASYAAYLDASTGAIVKLERRGAEALCAPTKGTSASATGYSQSGCNSPRSLWAAAASDRQPNFTHEGFRFAGSHIPDLEIYFGLPSSDPNYSTYMCPGKLYGVLPLKTVSGVVSYDDWTVGAAIPGKAGADAVFFTYQAMYTLYNNLGRWSYDNSGSVARVVVNAQPSYLIDNSQAVFQSGLDYAPQFSVAVGVKSARPYSYASCLDVVAHEWGHQVINKTAHWDWNLDYGGQLHEGFADVIGYATEWYRQPAGTGCEKAEWKFGEDDGTPARRVDVDDGPFGYTFHKDDDPQITEAHARGNMLGVAYRLLKDGGTNPVCGRLPSLSGCPVSVSGQGLTKASRILFRTLTVYCTSSTHWDPLGRLAQWSAWDLYHNCASQPPPGNSALAEQQAANWAFTAIGYPSDMEYETCGIQP